MNNGITKTILSIVIVLSLTFSFVACGNTTGSVSDNTISSGETVSNNSSFDEILVSQEESASIVLMNIDDYEVTREELYLFILQYLYNNSNIASEITPTAKADIINMCIDEIKMEIVEYKLATVTDGIEVTDERLADANEIANNFINYFGRPFLNKYGISENKVRELFAHQVYIEALKNKSMQDLTRDYTESYNEQYKDMSFFTIYYVLFPNIKYENAQPVIDSDGNYIKLNDEEMEKQLELATELRNKALDYVENGEGDGNLEELAEEYNVAYASGIEHNFHGAYNEELNALIDNLNDGDISEPHLSDAGYMIVRMDKTDDQEFKKYSIEYMASESAQKLYPNMQDTWVTSSGVAGLGVDPSLLLDIKVVEMCQDMNDNGFNITSGN